MKSNGRYNTGGGFVDYRAAVSYGELVECRL